MSSDFGKHAYVSPDPGMEWRERSSSLWLDSGLPVTIAVTFTSFQEPMKLKGASESRAQHPVPLRYHVIG
jgi:hypothetical protein